MQNEPKFIPVSNLTPENIADTAQENRKSRLANAIHKMDHDSARHQWISVAAYYKALARGFAPGLELDDWLDAEKDYAETMINLYISILEEDGAMTMVGLRQLAKAIGVENPENLHLKTDLIRAIQETCRTRPCFQLEPYDLYCETTDCQWKIECRKMVAVWKR